MKEVLWRFSVGSVLSFTLHVCSHQPDPALCPSRTFLVQWQGYSFLRGELGWSDSCTHRGVTLEEMMASREVSLSSPVKHDPSLPN